MVEPSVYILVFSLHREHHLAGSFWKNCPDVRGMCYVLRWHGKVPIRIIHYEDGGSPRLFFWQQNPEELMNRPPLSLASWALSLSEHSVTLRMLFLFFPWDMPFRLHLLSLQLSLEVGCTITAQSGDDKPPLPYDFGQTSLESTGGLMVALWLVLCSCPAPKLEAFDADKSSWKFHFLTPCPFVLTLRDTQCYRQAASSQQLHKVRKLSENQSKVNVCLGITECVCVES